MLLQLLFLHAETVTAAARAIGFNPIGIATCISLGLNPIALAAAVTVSAWSGGFLPIDGLPAMILGMGKYKLSQFFKFTIPMYLIKIVVLAAAAVVIFPM